jgi:peroxiredoxin
MMKKVLTLALLLAATAMCAAEPEVAVKALEVGTKAPAFSLVNATDGKTFAFQPGDGRTSVVVFTCNQCPYAKAFEQRIIDIARQYQPKGVVFYAVNPNDDAKYDEETMENMKARAESRNYPFPYLKDGDSAIARAYGARVTPHVFVVDGSGTLRYRGFVDDSAKPAQRTKTGLTDALDAVLAQRQVAESVTREFGCTIKWKS